MNSQDLLSLTEKQTFIKISFPLDTSIFLSRLRMLSHDDAGTSGLGGYLPPFLVKQKMKKRIVNILAEIDTIFGQVTSQ